jgi:hypothetical protein
VKSQPLRVRGRSVAHVPWGCHRAPPMSAGFCAMREPARTERANRFGGVRPEAQSRGRKGHVRPRREAATLSVCQIDGGSSRDLPAQRRTSAAFFSLPVLSGRIAGTLERPGRPTDHTFLSDRVLLDARSALVQAFVPGDWMELSIRDASRFVIGAAIIRDLAKKNSPDSNITLENVVIAALREGADGENLRTSIERLADQEAEWLRSTPPHTLTTKRVLHTRVQEIHALNSLNLAALATLELAADRGTAKSDANAALQLSYQVAIRAIDEMPGSTAERRALLQALETQAIEASGNAPFVQGELSAAEKVYLEQMMTERLAAYQPPSTEPSDDLDPEV